MGIGAGMAIVGSIIALRGENSIVPAKIVSRAVSGIVSGIISIGIHSDISPFQNKNSNS